MKLHLPLWEDIEAALPHRVYRVVARDILHIASFRMRNNMIKTCVRDNVFFSDMVADLMACTDSQQLINTVRDQLVNQLFPDKGNRCGWKLSDYFVFDLRVKVMQIKDGMSIEDLSRHLLFYSLDTKTSVVCGSAQNYRNFTTKRVLTSKLMDPDWEYAYDIELTTTNMVARNRLRFVNYPLPTTRFTNLHMADALNNIWRGVYLDLKNQGLVRHLLVLGFVCLVVQDFNDACGLKFDFVECRPLSLDNLS